MLKPRYRILCFLVTLSVLLPFSAVRADQPFQRLLPFLIDMAGWQGTKPEGMSMQMSDTSMTTATRDYERGEAKAHASIVIGPAAAGALAPIQSGMNMQTSEGRMVTSTVRGMNVLKAYNSKDKSGTLVVSLDKTAMFSFAYEGIAEEEAMALADKFDWKAMQVATQRK